MNGHVETNYMHCSSYCSCITVCFPVCFDLRNVPEGAEPEIISTIKKTFNFGQSEAVHLFQTLLECMKKKELVSRSCHTIILFKLCAFVDLILYLNVLYGQETLKNLFWTVSQALFLSLNYECTNKGL